MIKAFALWKGTTQKGQPKLTGQFGDLQVTVLENGYKKEDKHPDFIVYFDEPKKKEKPEQQKEPF